MHCATRGRTMALTDVLVYGLQWADPRVFVHFAEVMTIAALVLGGLLSALLVVRRRPALAVAVAACVM